MGAMLDEYERVIREFEQVITGLSTEDFTRVLDAETDDPDCRTAQTICNHVIRAGYGYCIAIRERFGDAFIERKLQYDVSDAATVVRQLQEMFQYTVEALIDKNDLTLEQIIENEIKSRWGQTYDVEQMVEHAIVHVMRHRRQIERLLSIAK
jgi:uncharacterized damage-inducible protein DinB